MTSPRWPSRRRSDGRDYTTFKGRKLFLDAVAEHVPEAVERLRAEPYRAFNSALASDPPRQRFVERSSDPVFGYRVAGGTGEKITLSGDWELPGWAHLHWEPRLIAFAEPGTVTQERTGLRERPTWNIESFEDSPQVRGFRDALLAWGREHHLKDLWCLDAAQKTLRWWYEVDVLGGQGEPPSGFADPDYVGPVVAPFTFPGFDPTQHNPAEWLTLLAAAGKEYTKRELARLELDNIAALKLRAVAFGVESSDDKIYQRVELDRRSAQHFAWLAVYQVGGLSFEKVAIRFRMGSRGTGRANVTRKIREKAGMIGLTLRGRNSAQPR